MVQFQEVLGTRAVEKITVKEACVLIPAYNEARHIAQVVESARRAGFAVWVLDDGSIDGTADAARSAGAQVFVSGRNQGKGACQRRGIQELLRTDFKALIFMDSDGQHDWRDLTPLLEALDPGRVDVAIGNRLDSPKGMPWMRRATNRLMSGIVSLAAGQAVPDSQCGFRALTREAAAAIHIRSNRFEAESEMILEASRRGYRIAAVPIRCHYGDEKSHIRPMRDTVRFLFFLARYLLTK